MVISRTLHWKVLWRTQNGSFASLRKTPWFSTFKSAQILFYWLDYAYELVNQDVQIHFCKFCIEIWVILCVCVCGRMKADTPVNSTMSVGQARKLVEQLKIEASFCRIKVRVAMQNNQKM